MSSTRKLLHLSSSHLIIVIILLIFQTYIATASSNKNNFQSIHKTKEANNKVNELFCYTCDVNGILDEDCLNMNQTRLQVPSRKCTGNETFCSVKRFSYTMSDKNSESRFSTSEKKLWSLQRNCTDKCENSCIIIGERVKIHACETCCQTNYCNVGSYATKLTLDLLSSLLIFLTVYVASSS